MLSILISVLGIVKESGVRLKFEKWAFLWQEVTIIDICRSFYTVWNHYMHYLRKKLMEMNWNWNAKSIIKFSKFGSSLRYKQIISISM